VSIQLLTQGTINKIAAGEVVERPASVVKELVENAIDAEAKAITIEVKEGGLKLIRVTDNGSGIAKEDVKRAFLRHATSKIREAKDLSIVNSLGFRGEALASIGAISMVELITKKVDDLTGIRYIFEGGEEKNYEEVGTPSGTTLIIKNIFYNTPARLKFMKTAGTEFGYVVDVVSKIAMGHPEISFKLIHNNKVRLHTIGRDQLKDSIYSIYGSDVVKNLIQVNKVEKDWQIQGFIGKPSISRGNRTYENYYINGRYIKSKLIEKAIENGFKGKLMVHQYPFVILHLTLPAKEVDVNVHPTKMEVRFNHEEAIYTFVYTTILEALYQETLIPDVAIDDKKKDVSVKTKEEVKEPFQERQQTVYKQVEGTGKVKESIAMDKNYVAPQSRIDLQGISVEKYIKLTKGGMEQSEKLEENKEEPSYTGDQIQLEGLAFTDSKSMQDHKVIGQLFGTYWIIELEKKYYIIDQHAAHEKILYERMVQKLDKAVQYAQKLLTPLVIELSVHELLRYERHKHIFKDLGFEIENFGDTSILIRWVPFIFNQAIDARQFLLILDHLSETYSEDKYTILLDKIASMSCKAAVKGNNSLSLIEYQQLIEDLLTLENPYTCPHGRPVIISMTQYELEKKFKRIQP